MAIVTVRTSSSVNRRIAGIAFEDGVAEVDDQSAAFQFFQRKGYTIEGESIPPAGTPLTEDELARVAAAEAAGDSGAVPEDQSEELSPPSGDAGTVQDAAEDAQGASDVVQPKRPHPVQDNLATWFGYLDQINPGHGLDLAVVKRKDVIEAVEALEAAKAATPE